MIPDINLIPKLEKEQSTSKYVYIILGVVSLITLAFFVWQYFSASNNITALQAQQTLLQQQREQLQSRQTELNLTQQNSIVDIVDTVDFVSYPVLPLINEIERLLSKNSYLREYEFDMASVTIEVDFETLGDISSYLTRLTNSDYFFDIQITNISQFDLRNGTDSQTIEEDFNVIPRHSSSITLFIDEIYLATGGERK